MHTELTQAVPFGRSSLTNHASSADHPRHSPWIIAMHWFSALLMGVAAGTVLLREMVEIQSFRILLMDLHRQAGLIILVGLVLRLAIRLRTGMVDYATHASKIMRFAALMAHISLYFMLAALPILGWAVCSAHETSLHLLGLMPLPNITEADADLADTLTDYHVWLAWGMLALVVLHIAAAFWHHLVHRDGVLVAMTPQPSKD
ncbi:MAG: cytochrome b [Leptothrix ochracea]|uniref:cytochrome b n=1 Tax=Leptothrix ochracea TaxID=735331 RepID=UPI0034E2B4E5